MKKIISICTALMLSTPLFAAALTTVNETDVSTGGSSAAGGSATVTGNSDAGAEVRTIMNSGSGGTTYKTEIQTESDGVVHTETKEGTIPASGRADIHIATSGKNIDIEVHAIVNEATGGSGLSSLFHWLFAPNASTSASADAEATSSSSVFFNAQDGFFSAFWKHIRAFFGFF